jgi:hypothetical protein
VAVCDIVVIGSYPPMPGPATAATLGAVRRAWAEGHNVAMVSYRTGAAPLVVPVTGPLAGWRLEQVRKHFGAPARVSLGLQAAVPFSDRRPWARWATAVGLAVALRRFSEATVVVGEDPGAGRLGMMLLARAASRFSTPDPELAERLVRRYRLAPGVVEVEEVAPFPSVPCDRRQPGGVTDGGLYAPGAGDDLVYVELPSTTTAQRLRARLHRWLPAPVRRLLRIR